MPFPATELRSDTSGRDAIPGRAYCSAQGRIGGGGGGSCQPDRLIRYREIGRLDAAAFCVSDASRASSAPQVSSVRSTFHEGGP